MLGKNKRNERWWKKMKLNLRRNPEAEWALRLKGCVCAGLSWFQWNQIEREGLFEAPRCNLHLFHVGK